ncbi:MAG: tetratricopeptide repeat protein, partial [Anaerolineales bacterium]|nr:tetratricopeptide repeat protein [Anaerolineales bacterium]
MPNGQDETSSSQTTASGAHRNITVTGDFVRTVLISGDGNQVILPHNDGLAFRLLDEAFRQQQVGRAPADFYNGTRANWANIARGHDARRRQFKNIFDFITAENPPQRAAVITGLSGEGKTTLLMRLAWEASQAGFPVLWRHYGTVEQPYERPFEQAQRVLLFLDELPYVDELPRLLADLSESGLPFVLLGTARTHEWHNSPLRSQTARLVAWQEFPLERLGEDEARGVLERLEQAGMLGALAERPPHARLDFFLDRLEADGQLLPALLTARKGRGFDAILEDVFERLEQHFGRQGVHFLLRGYAAIALVHRFGFWLSRPLLAHILNLSEAELTPRLLNPLRGELTEISEVEARRLYTRHPWIAERALGLLCGTRLPEQEYLYDDFYRALGAFLAAHPQDETRKLLSKLPLAFKYRGEFASARHLFRHAVEADPKDAVSLQAWALLEKEQGNLAEARELFRRASEADPQHAPTLQAWALLEKEQGNLADARVLFRRASQADPKDAVSLQAWALLEKELGNVEAARDLFRQAIQADPNHVPTLQSWAVMEQEYGNIADARQLLERAVMVDPCAPIWYRWALLEKEQGNLA